jgi:hypothetical protein
MQHDIEQANILEWAARYDGPLFHALITDPPYHLTSITDRFGKPGSAPAQFGTDGAFARASRGFMGRAWDGGRVAFEPETWAALGRLLHPGAFGMAFASTRGFHRMAVAIEDAGFIIHPMICWNFASGFPKATRIDVQVDRAAGAERAIVGTKPQTGAKFKLTQELIDNGGFNDPDRDTFDVTAPATPLAQAWAGHRYGLQSLKPAIEPIIVFQKPYAGRPVDSITRTGAGAINVDGGRIGTDGEVPRGSGTTIGYSNHSKGNGGNESVDGRWPANLLLSHTPDCNGECVPGCPVAALGAQSGESESTGGRTNTGLRGQVYGDYAGDRLGQNAGGLGDTGTAARFFFNADYAAERLEQTDPLVYVPKASTAEREAGLIDFDLTTVDDGREKPIDNPYQRGETTRRNIHPTIKPISLARHLATLLLPPDLYAPRRLLIPFAGVASEMIGAMLAGWEVVQGVELEAEHVTIARARLAYWQQMKYKLMNPDAPVKVTAAAVPDGQSTLW